MTIDSPEKFSSLNAQFNKLFSDILGRYPVTRQLLANPLGSKINVHVLLSVLLRINLDTTSENLIKHGEMLSLVIISFILVVRMFDQVGML